MDLVIRRRDHPHVAHLPVDDRRREVELVYHADRDRPAAGLRVVELALEPWWRLVKVTVQNVPVIPVSDLPVSPVGDFVYRSILWTVRSRLC